VASLGLSSTARWGESDTFHCHSHRTRDAAIRRPGCPHLHMFSNDVCISNFHLDSLVLPDIAETHCVPLSQKGRNIESQFFLSSFKNELVDRLWHHAARAKWISFTLVLVVKKLKRQKACVPQHVLLDLCVVCVFCYFSIDGYERYLQVEVYVRLIFIFCVVKWWRNVRSVICSCVWIIPWGMGHVNDQTPV